MTLRVRNDAPELWAQIVRCCRDLGIDWSEDEIANVIGKIFAPTPDDLPETIGKVLDWCARVERDHGDTDDRAVVALWRQLPANLIEITIEGDRIMHRLNPDIDVRIE